MLGRHVAAECRGISSSWRMHAGGCCVGYLLYTLRRHLRHQYGGNIVGAALCLCVVTLSCLFFLAEAILKDKQETNVRELLVLMDTNVEL